MIHLFTGLNLYTCLLLILALIFVLFYELINGFHDTANAVTTIIYTRAMQTQIAVIMSGIFNFLGVILGGLGVAYTIVHLLPTVFLLNLSSTHGLIMVFAMLLAAIIWNFSTWYIGLPASSSHTLIGAIIGVGLINSFVTHMSIIEALNISKIINIFSSLLLSPIIGFIISGLIIFCLRYFYKKNKKNSYIHFTPNEQEKYNGKQKPPFWIRIILIISSIGVSFSHGANDGQKGIGLIMLVLISVSPAGFVLNMNTNKYDIHRTHDAILHLENFYKQHKLTIKNTINPSKYGINIKVFNKKINYKNICFIDFIKQISKILIRINDYSKLTFEQRNHMRRVLIYLSDIALDISKLPKTSSNDVIFLKKISHDLLNTVEYAPIWIIIAVALALSIGTMLGWQRITVTIGKKIGKKDITYAQGMSTQITAALSIGIASYTSMPVSTTHIISAAVAGAMITDGKGIQIKTIKNILLAWIFTFPISVILSGVFYWILLNIL